jgi:hypothetical protein
MHHLETLPDRKNYKHICKQHKIATLVHITKIKTILLSSVITHYQQPKAISPHEINTF